MIQDYKKLILPSCVLMNDLNSQSSQSDQASLQDIYQNMQCKIVAIQCSSHMYAGDMMRLLFVSILFGKLKILLLYFLFFLLLAHGVPFLTILLILDVALALLVSVVLMLSNCFCSLCGLKKPRVVCPIVGYR